MTRSLKTISINFPFKNPAVVYEPTFSTSRALFDFDLVVVRPYSFLRRAIGNRSGGPFKVEWPELSRAKKEITGKIEDINRLLRQAGLLVVILDVCEILEFRSEAYYSRREIHTVSNYDFLLPDFHVSVSNGTGDRIEFLDPTDPFAKAIKVSSVQWTAFLSGRPPYPFNRLTIFARNGADSYVGASTEFGAGHIVYLPNFEDLNEDKFFEACHDYRFVREGTPPPIWVPLVFLPGEAAAEAGISELDDKLRQLQDARDVELQKRDGLLSFKKLLFEKGKRQLEPIVRKALDALAFQTSPGENIAGTQFEIDGRTNQGSLPGILEIKGSKNQISIDEFSPFVTKILADFQNTGVHRKGILIANGLCVESPEKRLGERVFSPHVLEAAKRHSIALVNSVEVYWIVCGALSGDITDFAPIREKILTTNGYVNLSGFCMKSPFVAK